MTRTRSHSEMKKAMLAVRGLERGPRSGASGFLRIAVLCCLCVLCAVATSAQQPGTAGVEDNAKHTFTTFDAPGVDLVPGQGTVPSSINTAGVIAGGYNPTGGVVSPSGFVRAADGTITEFIPRGTLVYAAYPVAINAAGTITGYYLGYTTQPQQGGYVLAHCFVRTADGTFTTVDAPGAGTGAYPEGQGTTCTGINAAGVIAGSYVDANGLGHGFARTAGGTMISFDPPGSAGTAPLGISDAGVIAGFYADASGVYHGFVRAARGAITSFDAPGAGTTGPFAGTQARSINTAGTIAGYYLDASNVYHGFARAAGGAITTFDAPGAGTLSTEGTWALSINTAGAIVGGD